MEFTHFDEAGNARMVDVSGKEETKREAVARGFISMNRECLNLVKAGSMAKGDVLGAARIAGIMGAKRYLRADSPVPSAESDQTDSGF